MRLGLCVLFGVLTALEYGCGIAAITTGRVWAPWARRRVLRPRLWGWAQLAGAAMLTVYLLHYALGLAFPLLGVLAFSLILMIASAVLNQLALKSPRTAPLSSAPAP